MSEIKPPAKRAFAYQAAQFALYGPIIVLVFGLCMNFFMKQSADPATAQMQLMMRMVQAVGSLLLLALSVVMGIVALVAIRRLGGAGLLGRSITGIVLSVLLLAAGLYGVYMGPLSARMAQRIAGEWSSTVSAPGVGSAHVLMSLAADGTARWRLVDGPRPMEFHGKWRVGRQRDTEAMMLRIDFETAATTQAQFDGLGWVIEHVQDDRLELKTQDANGKDIYEHYTRVK